MVAINNTIAGTDTTLIGPPSPTPGDYFLTVGSYCPGAYGFDSAPYDADSQPLWNFANNRNVSIPPNGPGAANPMYIMAAQANCEVLGSTDAYFAKITLNGACHVPPPNAGCPDLNGDGVVSLQNLAILLAVFGTGCP